MVHSVEQPNLMDSLAPALDYTCLLDMFSSPLLPPEEQQQPPQMNSQEAIPPLEKCYDPNSYDLIAQLMSNGVLEEIPNHQIEGQYKSFGGDINMMIDSGSTRIPSDPKTTTTTKVVKLKKKGLSWTKSEHELFLEGMERYGKGDWKSIARTHVLTRTAAQVASHAQKYFARLKRIEKTGGVCLYKAGVSSKDSHSLAMPVVEPTVNVPQSDNGNVPTTFLNPTSDFVKVPHTFTNRRPEESSQTNSTIPFSSRDSTIINHADLFPPWKFSEVNPTSYVPPLDVFPSDEDVYIPSIDFITKPTSENTNVPTTIYVPPSGNICPDPDLSIHSRDSISAPSSNKFNIYPTISVCPLNEISTNPNVWIQSLDFPKNPCSDTITANPSNLVYPLYNSFPDHDVYRPSLDLLDALPSNNTLVHPTFYAPPSNVSTFDSTITLPPNDFTAVHPAVSFAPPSYYTVGHTASFTPCPSDTAYLPPQDDAYVIKW